jgi:hypothetical protein
MIMTSLMIPSIPNSSEGLLTVTTLVRLLPRVSPQVHVQVAFFREDFSAFVVWTTEFLKILLSTMIFANMVIKPLKRGELLIAPEMSAGILLLLWLALGRS